MKFYTIRCVPFAQGATWLIEADDDGVLSAAGKLIGASAEMGRLAAPKENVVRYELEDPDDDSRIAAPQPFDWLGNGDVFVDAPFLQALEDVGVTQFRAVPLTCAFGSIRTWDSFWRIRFEQVVRKELIDGTELVFREKDSRTQVYYSEAAKAAITALGWWLIEWHEHELPVCDAVPLANVGDAEVLLRLADLFRAKSPRVAVGSSYGASYFVDRLLEVFSDITEERLCAIVEADKSGPFSTKDGRWLGVREGTALAEELSTS